MLTSFAPTTTASELEHSMIMSLARDYAKTGRPTSLDSVRVWLAMDKGFDVPTIRKIAKSVAGHATQMSGGIDENCQQVDEALASAALNGFPGGDA